MAATDSVIETMELSNMRGADVLVKAKDMGGGGVVVAVDDYLTEGTIRCDTRKVSLVNQPRTKHLQV